MIYGHVNPMDSFNTNCTTTTTNTPNIPCEEIKNLGTMLAKAEEPGPCNIASQNRQLINCILENVNTIEGLLFGCCGECKDKDEPFIDCLSTDLKIQHEQLEYLSKKIYVIKDRISQ